MVVSITELIIRTINTIQRFTSDTVVASATLGFSDTGTIQILDLQKDVPAYHFNYTYDIRQDNFNGRTIQGFSIDAEKEMYTCENCPYADYEKFVEYYNAFDYGKTQRRQVVMYTRILLTFCLGVIFKVTSGSRQPSEEQQQAFSAGMLTFAATGVLLKLVSWISPGDANIIQPGQPAKTLSFLSSNRRGCKDWN
jgi:hypothetical protein